MKVSFKGNSCIVTREAGDQKYHGIRNASGESNFLYALNQKLKTMGFDMVKKRMHKDGHLVDEMQHYLRSRVTSPGKGAFCIYSPFFAIRGSNEDFNDGEVRLAVTFLHDEEDFSFYLPGGKLYDPKKNWS